MYRMNCAVLGFCREKRKCNNFNYILSKCYMMISDVGVILRRTGEREETSNKQPVAHLFVSRMNEMEAVLRSPGVNLTEVK